VNSRNLDGAPFLHYNSHTSRNGRLGERDYKHGYNKLAWILGLGWLLRTQRHGLDLCHCSTGGGHPDPLHDLAILQPLSKIAQESGWDLERGHDALLASAFGPHAGSCRRPRWLFGEVEVRSLVGTPALPCTNGLRRLFAPDECSCRG
jgi:hypothetical protein